MSLEFQLDVIRTSAAIFPLSAGGTSDIARAFLRITGSDATRWLNGMVTNNIAALAPGEGNYNFLLNAQGRIQGDCTVYREPRDGPATYLLETDKSQLETIQTHLDKFIIMDDVELTAALTDKVGLLLIGPGALGTLDVGLIWPTPPISLSHAPEIYGQPLVLSVSRDLGR
jgi:glycine cleavage system aminomethyltransferase T